MHISAAGKAKRLWEIEIYLQHFSKDKLWLVWESGEIGCTASNSCLHRSIMPSVSSAHIATYTKAIRKPN